MQRQTVNQSVVVWLALAVIAPIARADVPTPTGVCVANCGTSSSSSSSNDGGAAARARAAEKALYRRIDQENAARKKLRQKEMARRKANIEGLKAARKKKWAAAVKLLEKAQRQHPGDSLIAANLAAVRVKIDEQKAQVATKNAAAAAKRRPIEVPPPPVTTPIETPATPLTTTTIALGSLPAQLDEVPADVAVWGGLKPAIDIRQVLDARRQSFASVIPDAKDVTLGIAKSVGAKLAGAGSILSFRDRIAGAGQMRARYNQLATDLTNEATGAAQEAASILGGDGSGEGSTQHVLDAPVRMARIVNQFVSDEFQNMIWGRIKGWGKGTANGLVKDALSGGNK
jgi:hypothetical protein